jgi:hypothetical protein
MFASPISGLERSGASAAWLPGPFRDGHELQSQPSPGDGLLWYGWSAGLADQNFSIPGGSFHGCLPTSNGSVISNAAAICLASYKAFPDFQPLARACSALAFGLIQM